MSILRFPSLTFLTALSQKKRSNVPSKKYRNFNLLFLMATATPMLFVGAFNFIVDPYDIFNTPNYFGINHSKPQKDNNDRLFKAIDVTRIRPIVILMGSSRAKQGLDPGHPALGTYKPVYNLAINGPNTYEVFRYLQHAISNQENIKEVILGIDFFMFNDFLKNQPSFSEERLEKQHISLPDATNALFSLDTLWVSLDTANSSLNEPNKDVAYGENGFMPNRNANDGKTKWRFNQSLNLYFTLHANYKFSDKYLSDFKALVNLCKQHNIILKVFISPAHATEGEAIRITNQWKTFEQWKREITKITSVWDFSGYNSITTEPIKDRMKNYVDNSHYSRKIGDLILDRILSYQEEKVPNDFGTLLTSDNIEGVLKKNRINREVWAKNNPQDAQLVKDIKRRFDLLKQQSTRTR
jgi:hypothetical protein